MRVLEIKHTAQLVVSVNSMDHSIRYPWFQRNSVVRARLLCMCVSTAQLIISLSID
jgi:hypothetical protein